MKEIWKPIKESNGIYEVSNLGRVKSIERKDRLGRPVKERILKQAVNHNHYMQVMLCIDCKRINYVVHRLVAEAFIPNEENKPYVNHIDLNRSNNVVTNLEWCTQKENLQHAVRMGVSPKGERNSQAKLTREQVLEILKLSDTGIRSEKLGYMFGVSGRQVRNILNNIKWKHVKEEYENGKRTTESNRN